MITVSGTARIVDGRLKVHVDLKFDPSQPRDEYGRFSSGGGGGGGGSGASKPRLFTEEEENLPPKVKQAGATKEEVYDSARKAKESYDDGLDHGRGVDKALGGKAVRPVSAEEFMQALDEEGPLVILAPLKGERRAEEKVRDKYGGDWGRLGDVVRATVVVDKVGDIPRALEAVREKMKEKGWEIAARPDNKMEHPLLGGYRDIALAMRGPNGHVAELQVNTKPMVKAKEGRGHKLYEEYRVISEPLSSSGKPPTSEQRARLGQLEGQMQSLYAAAWEASQ